VESQLFALCAVIKLEVCAVKKAVHEKTTLFVADDFGEARGARGLQAEQKTGGLQHGRFPQTVGSYQDVAPGLEVGFKPLETTKMAYEQLREHCGRCREWAAYEAL
ncbi:MAG: hypothetical protein ORN83_12460, partial [Chthoniobacteraceae bacterium]|nr:hypothetical protein [Chthoniobacteraceae bacterium]